MRSDYIGTLEDRLQEIESTSSHADSIVDAYAPEEVEDRVYEIQQILRELEDFTEEEIAVNQADWNTVLGETEMVLDTLYDMADMLENTGMVDFKDQGLEYVTLNDDVPDEIIHLSDFISNALPAFQTAHRAADDVISNQ